VLALVRAEEMHRLGCFHKDRKEADPGLVHYMAYLDRVCQLASQWIYLGAQNLEDTGHSDLMLHMDRLGPHDNHHSGMVESEVVYHLMVQSLVQMVS
jgi:hypothetical protein